MHRLVVFAVALFFLLPVACTTNPTPTLPLASPTSAKAPTSTPIVRAARTGVAPLPDAPNAGPTSSNAVATGAAKAATGAAAGPTTAAPNASTPVPGSLTSPAPAATATARGPLAAATPPTAGTAVPPTASALLPTPSVAPAQPSPTSPGLPQYSPTPVPPLNPTATPGGPPTATPLPTATPPSTPTQGPPPSGEATIALLPESSSVRVGDIFNLSIQVNSGTQPVDAVEIHLNFDPRFLQVVDSAGNVSALIDDPGQPLNVGLQNVVDGSAGTIDYAVGKLSGTRPAGMFVVGSIRLKALAPTTGSGTTVRFVMDVANNRNTEVVNEGDSVFGGARDGVIAIGGT